MIYNKVFCFLGSPVEKGWKRIIFTFLAFLENLFWHLVMYFGKEKQNESAKYNVTICCMFKNEALFLKEWLLYHKIVGIDHVYLYNNQSSDNYLDILKPFIEEGFVTLTNWPMPQGQIPAYEDWYGKYRRETRWNCFVDVDEFICPYYETNVGKWLERYSRYPAVKMYWKMFGTSGIIEHDYTKLVTDQYHVCWEKYYNVGKQFYNTSYDISAFKINVHHSMNCDVLFMGRVWHVPSINEFYGFDNHFGVIFSKKNFSIQLNHYQCKSYMSYIALMDKSDSAHKINPRGVGHFLAHENKCCACDFHIFRFLMQLKIKYWNVSPNIFNPKIN